MPKMRMGATPFSPEYSTNYHDIKALTLSRKKKQGSNACAKSRPGRTPKGVAYLSAPNIIGFSSLGEEAYKRCDESRIGGQET